MKPPQSKDRPDSRPTSRILILTGSIGSGHLSVARTIADEIHRISGGNVEIEIVDFLTEFANFVTKATKEIYLNSLKLSPKIYELIFTHSADVNWPVKLLNMLSAPFMQQKFLNLMKDKNPQILISTFPVWDFLIKKTWKKYNELQGTHLPFVSVITDSTNVHSAWTIAKPDYYIVPNDDTKVTLLHYDVPEEKIKVFGYPVANCFFKPSDKIEFQKKWNLSPKKKTLLMILSTGMRWTRVKELIKAIQESALKNLQLLVVATAHPSWKKKIETKKFPWPIQVTGWTNEMHTLIHNADIILTKAGGATVMECIASQKPLIITEAIPGQEIGNAVLVQKYNVGVVLNRDLSDFDHAITYILENDVLIKKNLAKLQKPNAGKDIAQFLLGLL